MIIWCSVTIRKWDVDRTVCDYTLSETLYYRYGMTSPYKWHWRCSLYTEIQFYFQAHHEHIPWHLTHFQCIEDLLPTLDRWPDHKHRSLKPLPLQLSNQADDKLPWRHLYPSCCYWLFPRLLHKTLQLGQRKVRWILEGEPDYLRKWH